MQWLAPAPVGTPYSADIAATLTMPARETHATAAPDTGSDNSTTGAQSASALNWRSIESSDWGEFIARLRSSGIPERYVRAIVLADLREQLNPTPRQYWQSDSSLARIRRKAADVGSEQEIQSFLAEHGLPAEETGGTAGNLGFLPEPTRKSLTAAIAPADARIAELELRNSSGAWEQDDLDALNAVKAGRAKAAQHSLTPEQFLKWEAAQGDGVAERLQRLPGFEFQTEQDFLGVYAVERDINDKLQAPNTDLAALSTEREQRLGALLGNDRLQAYQRSQNSAFAGDIDFARRTNQPQALAESLFDTRKAFMERERQILATPADPEARESQIQHELASYRQTIQTRLGPAFEAYLDGPGGWLNR